MEEEGISIARHSRAPKRYNIDRRGRQLSVSLEPRTDEERLNVLLDMVEAWSTLPKQSIYGKHRISVARKAISILEKDRYNCNSCAFGRQEPLYS